MKAKLHRRAALLPVVALFALPGAAQELTLFQDDGNGFGRGGFQQGAPPLAAPAPSAPPVMLKGIYRFGDTYHLSLQTGEGGAVQTVAWQAGQANPPVFNGYQIQVVDTRNVTLGLPPGVSCQADLQSGANCVGRGQMSLTFAQTDPLSDRRPQRRGNDDDDDRRRNNNNDNNNEWWAQGNATDMRQLIEAVTRGGGARELIEAQIRGQRGRGGNNAANAGGRGGNAANGNAGGRGGRGGGNNGGGRGGGPRGNGQ